MSEEAIIQVLPVLPIKNTVLFPYLQLPLSVGRPVSMEAVEKAMASEEKEILVVAQRDATVDFPKQDDLYPIGTKAIIKKMTRTKEGMQELVVQGVERVVLLKIEQTTPHLTVRVRILPLPVDSGAELEALHRSLLELASKILGMAQPQSSLQLGKGLATTEDPLRLVYLLGSMLGLDLDKEQSLLAAETRVEALRLMHGYLTYEVQVLELRQKIAGEAQTEMSRAQREYLLRQQLRAIQQELGEENPEQADIAMLRERVEKGELPEDVKKEAERELQRLEKLPAASPEHNVIRTHLELILELPWTKSTESVFDPARARQVLDEDHYDLKDVKERILEQLGVLKLNPEAKAPILCFVGPPGVGKTSLGQSIARALGRTFERMSLGGMHDEAELRGHRRTYIGAMPGRIIQAIRRAGVKNPVLMLDEVDKLGRDFRGDPAAALLEILDPEQNRSFRDNYLDIPFDLSKVLFITTANTLDTVPQPLLDRMETLRLTGYSEEEKIEIARNYLIPRQLKQTGVTVEQFQINDNALQIVIARYTREAGVRQLERAIGRLARKKALQIAEDKFETALIQAADVFEMLGPELFFQEQARRELPPGVATGLAWTEAGGDVLYIEAALLPEGRTMMLTGQLGDVMQESAKAARSYIWSHVDELGIDPVKFRRFGVHIHVPAGAIPKDGPSAGITMATALASLYTECPVRTDTAMTGELTLSGLVLPIGGVKEKVLAARRAGIRRVILPKQNEKDLRELPEHVRNDMEFIPVERIEDVLAAAIPSRVQHAPVGIARVG